MAFYTDLSGAYDALFPASAAQWALFEDLRKTGDVHRVVDAGCGSGAQILAFAAAGISCFGFDPDPALVALARKKIEEYPNARVETGGFADLARLVEPGVDLLLCLGNSLVHVPQEEAAQFLRDAFSLTAVGGRLLLQILNYERLLKSGITELPLLQAGDGMIEFRRRYVWEGERKVRFQTVLRIAAGDEPQIVRNDIPLYPLYPDELWEMVARAGYTSIKFFEDFCRKEFGQDSEALVCMAVKS